MEQIFPYIFDNITLPPSYVFDLQRFASAEDEGRTELPTEQKKRRSREEGNIPVSAELSGIIIFLSIFFTITLFWRYFHTNLQSLMRFYIENIDTIPINKNNVQAGTFQLTLHLMRILGPIMGVAVVSTLVVSLAQTQFLFTTKKLAPDFSKVFGNIFKNLQKMFWSKQTLFNLGKSLMKVVAVFGIAFLLGLNELPSIIAYMRMEPNTSFGMAALLIVKFTSAAGFLLLVFAVADYVFQYSEYIEQLKMTKKELRDEIKEEEGDPAIKAKIRQLESQLGMRRMMAAVPTADVVITNPTHYAIAVKYDKNIGSAPIVVAKGTDRTALRIRELASENNVPIHENKPLARGLYDMVNVGEEIPFEYWQVVADILSLVYTARGSMSETLIPETVEYI